MALRWAKISWWCLHVEGWKSRAKSSSLTWLGIGRQPANRRSDRARENKMAPHTWLVGWLGPSGNSVRCRPSTSEDLPVLPHQLPPSPPPAVRTVMIRTQLIWAVIVMWRQWTGQIPQKRDRTGLRRNVRNVPHWDWVGLRTWNTRAPPASVTQR